jgi:uncharacterized membrane protein YphA (DoxX/SURF4 family)
MRISLLTVLFLVALRLAIGWHFLFEGVQKVRSTLVGPTTTSKPFSSEGYFRETSGPLSAYLRHEIGDPDELALARLTVVPVPAGQDPRDVPLIDRVPPALNKDWNDYFIRFESFYQLSDPQNKEAKAFLNKAKTDLAAWLTDTDVDLPVVSVSTVGLMGTLFGGGPFLAASTVMAEPVGEHTKVVTKTFNASSFETKETMPVRIAEYRVALNDLHEIYDKKLPLMNRDVEKANLTKRRNEVRQLRESLVSELDARTADMKKGLASILNGAQKEKGRMEDEPQQSKLLKWLDRGTVWGLTAIGFGMFFGLFTRLSCLLAAGFLLMTYGAEPSFPWLPVSPKSEGNYVWVNKNVVEMLALLLLATTQSGRWLGLDGLVHWMFSGRKAPKKS